MKKKKLLKPKSNEFLDNIFCCYSSKYKINNLNKI